MYFRKKTSGGRAYLQIVESRRDGAEVRQQMIATLGRIEDLRDSGQLEWLLRSGTADRSIASRAFPKPGTRDCEPLLLSLAGCGCAINLNRPWL